MREGCETDLRELRRDVLDVVHLRYMGKHAPVPFAEQLDAMIALRNEGKIRHLALSNVGPTELELALARTPIVCVQNLYSVAGGGGELARMTHAEVEEPERVLEICEERDIAFMPFFPLGVGTLAKAGGVLTAAAKRPRKPGGPRDEIARERTARDGRRAIERGGEAAIDRVMRRGHVLVPVAARPFASEALARVRVAR